MSSKLHGLVWEGCAHTGMILSRVAVMARLADYSNDDGVSWPAIETIQRQIGAKSKNTVSAAISELERDGWLVKTERKEGGRNLSNIYKINVDKLESAAASAKLAYKSKKQGVRNNPPNIDPSNINPPNIDPSTVGEKGLVNPPMVDPDPSVKTDPSLEDTSCPNAPQPDELPDYEFLTRHPEAVVFSAKKKIWGSRGDLKCAEWIWGRIIRMYEQAAECDGEISRPKEPNWESWANEIRLMCTIDNRTHRQICELYGLVNRDAFWCKNVLSPSKLREKWDELTLKLRANPQGGVVTGGHWNSAEAWENTL